MAKIRVALLAASVLVGNALADDSPIVGKWQWTIDPLQCTETYDYKADGSLHVSSGDEVSDNTWSITAKPGANGFYTLTGRMTKTNGGKDCTGEQASELPPPFTMYILFNPSRQMFIACEKPEIENCFGPLRKIN